MYCALGCPKFMKFASILSGYISGERYRISQRGFDFRIRVVRPVWIQIFLTGQL